MSKILNFMYNTLTIDMEYLIFCLLQIILFISI